MLSVFMLVQNALSLKEDLLVLKGQKNIYILNIRLRWWIGKVLIDTAAPWTAGDLISEF